MAATRTSSDVVWTVEDAAVCDELRRGAWMAEDAAAGNELRRGVDGGGCGRRQRAPTWHGRWRIRPPARFGMGRGRWDHRRRCLGARLLIPRKYHLIRDRNSLIPDRYHLILRKYHLIRDRNRLIPYRYHL
uniref:Uncharacterized protein n=1 Tax=Oryza punctata TaxID=4537 RepID=A0A0E0LHA0_ORYPU